MSMRGKSMATKKETASPTTEPKRRVRKTVKVDKELLEFANKNKLLYVAHAAPKKAPVNKELTAREKRELVKQLIETEYTIKQMEVQISCLKKAFRQLKKLLA